MEKLARNGLITLDYGGRKADKWIQRTPLTEFFWNIIAKLRSILKFDSNDYFAYSIFYLLVLTAC